MQQPLRHPATHGRIRSGGGSRYTAGMTLVDHSARSAYSPSLANLRSLLAMRGIALFGQAAVLAWVVWTTRSTQPPWGMALALLGMTLLTAASLWWSRGERSVSDREFFVQIMLDIVGWTALMYTSGGADNPFVSYYIVPLVVAAAVLPWTYTWWVAGAAVTAYSLLLVFNIPFPLFSPHAGAVHAGMHHSGPLPQGDLHRLGMWFNFLFSAGLITFFVVRMGGVLRRQEAREAARRENRLRHDQILAVASLAAGTAHRLGTPLSTMTILLEDLQEDADLGQRARDDLSLLRGQLGQCREILRELSDTAELSETGERQRAAVTRVVDTALQTWAARRPGVSCELRITGSGEAPIIAFDQTLPQALENLFNNAADTGSTLIETSVDWDQRECIVAIRDRGPGVSAELSRGLRAAPGQHRGLGIGLVLTRATAERHGGSLSLDNASDGPGAVATLRLPRENRV